jgi:Ca2+-binding EF-hand superfamily protein
VLSQKEVYALIDDKDYAVDKKFIEGVWKGIDIDDNGTLDIDEFMELMKLVRKRHADNLSEV